MEDAKFTEVDLTGLANDGVLMAANERFFWPLGLALTWHTQEGKATELHIRQWDYGDDNHHETIQLEDEDLVGIQRREAFLKWITLRIETLPDDESQAAIALIGTISHKGKFLIS